MPVLAITDAGRPSWPGEDAGLLPAAGAGPPPANSTPPSSTGCGCCGRGWPRSRERRRTWSSATPPCNRWPGLPGTPDAFRRINGVGRKLTELGPAFMQEISEHVESNGRSTFAQAAAPGFAARKPLGDSEYDTLRRFRAGQAVEEIARERGIKESTVLGHLSAAADSGEEVALDTFVPAESQPEVAAAFRDLGWGNLTGVHERLGGRYDYAALRIYRAQRSGRVAVA